MEENYKGGCLCGEIRYECLAAPKYSYICHCRDCKKAHGSAYLPGMMFSRESVRIVGGSPRDYTVTGEGGMGITRRFCPTCGSLLFIQLERFPKSVAITAGTLDDPSGFKPMTHLWSQSEMPWEHVEDGVERYPKAVPPGK